MTSRRRWVILPLLNALLLLMPCSSGAVNSTVTIGALPPAKCPENSGVYTVSSDRMAKPGICRFAFVLHWERNEPESEALILIDDMVVTLHRTDDNKNDSGLSRHYAFANLDGTIMVRLDAKGTCPSDVEGCDYAGSLSVNTVHGNAVIKVAYYRGG